MSAAPQSKVSALGRTDGSVLAVDLLRGTPQLEGAALSAAIAAFSFHKCTTASWLSLACISLLRLSTLRLLTKAVTAFSLS